MNERSPLPNDCECVGICPICWTVYENACDAGFCCDEHDPIDLQFYERVTAREEWYPVTEAAS